jgi:predicted lipoprotein with Yx(FWY)xxD motif
MKRAALAFTLALAVLVVPAVGAAAPKPTLTVRGSSYGKILFDGRGYVLYAFTKDARGRSACSGDCARAWPPYIVKGPLRAAAGLDAKKLGTTKRADGRLQVTYAGRPLYYYVGDDGPGVIRCQNVFEFGGAWLVLRASGALVR